MPANFDFLKDKKEYALFSEACIKTEKILSTSLALCIIGSYEALELAVRWVYSIENISTRDKYNELDEFLSDPLFISLVDKKVCLKLPFIIKLWKYTLKSGDKLVKDDGVLVLSIIFEFVTWIDYTYGFSNYKKREFNEENIPVEIITSIDEESALNKRTILNIADVEVKRLQEQLAKAREFILERKDGNINSREFNPRDFNIISIREYYIDLDLKFAGWDSEIDVKKKVDYTIGNVVDGKEKVVIDYLLMGKDGLPLAIIEGRYSLEDFEYGKNRALKYAAHIGGDMRHMPFIFLVHEGNYYYIETLNSVPRKLLGIFNIEDLHRIKNNAGNKKNFLTVSIDPRITNLSYQVEAVKTLTEDIGGKKRKGIAFITGGIGKERILGEVIDFMSRANYISSVLYLTGRKANLKSTKQLLKTLIFGMSVGEYSEEIDDNTNVVISTTELIMKEIGNISGSGEKYFSHGQFDLIVVDEVHRNTVVVYKKIFDYFDSLIVGISAVPKSDVDSGIIDFFQLKDNTVNYTYHYEEALQKEKLLVPYNVVGTSNRPLESEMYYDKLSADNKNVCEETYTDNPRKMLNWVPSPTINEYLMSEYTIDSALEDLLKVGIKVSKSESIGKTIIFAQNKSHGEAILQRFRMTYPQYGSNFAKIAHCDDRNSVDDFIDSKHNVNILIDVGFATAGLNLPEVVNIVLFKKIYSKYEFHQMLSMGNRICPNIVFMDPKEGVYTGKKRYYVFDYLENFEFFDEEKNSIDGVDNKNISEDIFHRCVEIVYSIQKGFLINREYQAFSEKIVNFLIEEFKKAEKEFAKVGLKLENFAKFHQKNTFFPILKEEDKNILIKQISPMIKISEPDRHALQFDNFMYGLMLSQLEETAFVIKAKKQLGNICNMLGKNEHVLEIKREKDLIDYYGSKKFLDSSTVVEMEQLRAKIRGLMKYVFQTSTGSENDAIIETKLANLENNLNATKDVVMEKTEKTEESEDIEEIREYKKKVEAWIQSKMRLSAIYRLRNNMPLLPQDYKDLERAFTKTLGSKEDYKDAYGDLPYGFLVRKTVSLERESVKVAFFTINTDKTLNEEQKEFLKKLMEYIISNGYMDEDELLNDESDEFTEFKNIFDIERQNKILKILKEIKNNANY